MSGVGKGQLGLRAGLRVSSLFGVEPFSEVDASARGVPAGHERK